MPNIASFIVVYLLGVKSQSHTTVSNRPLAASEFLDYKTASPNLSESATSLAWIRQVNAKGPVAVS